jgi:trans-2,3-dihydro-3-hydroxyanthranilate isomerase
LQSEETMPDYPYQVVDVFTDTRFGGNQLAVITDARGMDAATMQLVAAEFGFSETTFVLPPDDPAHTARVRIFTPTVEMPFAGHPNVGTAYVLAGMGHLFDHDLGDELVFEEIAGLVTVRVLREDGLVRGAAITAPRPLELGQELDPAIVADCVGLTVDDIALVNHRPCFLSVGAAFLGVELRSRQALAKARPIREQFEQADAAIPRTQSLGLAIFLYVPSADDPDRLDARMFAPLDNIPEDPATGSASAALAAFLAHRLPAADADLTLTIAQGEDMGRPSTLRLQATKVAGQVTRVEVGGACVPVMRGVLTLE